METNDFKLLAIRPLSSCDLKYSKNLHIGFIYKFYNNYSFFDKDDEEIKNGINSDNEVAKVTYNPSDYTDLYTISTQDKDIKINISAIVGKNGSGKSTLLELYYILCYVISSYKGIIKNPNFYTEFIKKNDNKISQSLIDLINDIQNVYQSIDIEVFYSIDAEIYSIRFSEPHLYHRLIAGTNINFDTSYYKFEESIPENLRYVFNEIFFYTISINYSLYGLNSESSGKWLSQLFHKNDGYQTPLVINPFRNKGIIDVNSEFHLSQSRLLSNLINEDFSLNKIVNDKEVKDITFELDYENFYTLGILSIDNVINKFKDELGMDDKNFFVNVYNAIYTNKSNRISGIEWDDVPHINLIIKYLYRKVFKIALNYDEYKEFVEIPEEGPPIPSFNSFFRHLIKLKEDRSHITLKLRQILNTIRFNTLKEDNLFKWISDKSPNDKFEKYFFKIDLTSLTKRIAVIKNENKINLIELIPIACYKQYLQINNKNAETTTSTFESLSSGEQQYIHSLQSIYYHLANINSVFDSGTDKIKYNYINIILDEIELYYHPEFQRKFLYDFLEGLKSLRIQNIKGINIIFSTHSPFILSDIPHTNILKLDDGKPLDYNINDKTFGANIHELLANDFFLENGFMGKWAKTKILDLIIYLKFDSKKKISDENLKPEFNWSEKNSKKFIDIIGEPIIRDRLLSLYEKKFHLNDKEYYEFKINEYIEKLKLIKE